MSSWFNPKTEKRTSPIQGRGLFARVAIPAGEVVAVKGGAILDCTEFALVRDQVSPAAIQIEDHLYIAPRLAEEVEVPQDHHRRRLAPPEPSAPLRWLLLALHRGPLQWLRRIARGGSAATLCALTGR